MFYWIENVIGVVLPNFKYLCFLNVFYMLVKRSNQMKNNLKASLINPDFLFIKTGKRSRMCNVIYLCT